MSTATLSPVSDPGDEFDRITARLDNDERPARPRFAKSRSEVMTVQDAISASMGRRRYRTREREA
jgi:hypothetical protein